MKTNKILMAVALPALLAACTAEEVVEQSSVANLSNRALLNPNFSVGVTEGVDSRFAWEEMDWIYQVGDQFGTGVVDPAEIDVISNSSMIGNYVFVKGEDGKYHTDSQMQEGTYMFYSYGGFKTKNVRSLVPFDISSQKTDLSDPEAILNDYNNQLMFSPLFKVEAEYSEEFLPLEFRSFWGVAAFKFKNNTGQTLKINQIVLKEDKGGKFIVKGGINPEDLNKADLKYVYNENGEAYAEEFTGIKTNYVPVRVSDIINSTDVNYTAANRKKDIKKEYERFAEALYTKSASKDVNDNGESSFIALNCQNYKMKHGETVTAYMFVPQHKGDDLSVEIMVVDEEDESWSVFVEAENLVDSKNNAIDYKEVEGLDKLEIKRHKTNAIFGKTTDGKSMKTLSIVEDDLQENSGYYIDNNEALKALINANLGKITVHNTGDTYIDKDIIEAIKEYTGAHVTFSNAIEIKSAEALVNDADKDIELALTQITFNGGAIVKGADKKNGINGTVEFGSDVVFGEEETLYVEEGATVTLTDGEYNDIENSGDLKIAKGIELETLTNEAGSVTLNTDKIEKVVAEAGSVSFACAKKADEYDIDASDLTIKAGANLTIGQYVTLNVDEDFVVDADYVRTDDEWNVSTLTSNGAIEIGSGKTLTVEHKFVNNGLVSGGTLKTLVSSDVKENNITKVYHEPVIENNADGEINTNKIVIKNGTTVTNAGRIGDDSESVEMYGDVKMTSINSRLTVTDCVDEDTDDATTEAREYALGKVENSVNGVVDAPAEMLVYAVMGDMTDGVALKEFDIDSDINMIKVNGTWTITANPKDGESAEYQLERLGIKVVEFVKKNAVDIRSTASLDLRNVKVVVSSVEKVMFTGRTDGTSTMYIDEIENGTWKDGTTSRETEWGYRDVNMYLTGAALQAEIDAATAGKTVTLKGNILTDKAISVDKELTIDMGGYTIAMNEPALSNTQTTAVNTGVITTTTGADLTLKKGTVSGVIKWNKTTADEGKNTSVCAVLVEAGKVTIESGNYLTGADRMETNYDLAGTPVIQAKKGSEVIIEGGVFEALYPCSAGGKYVWQVLNRYGFGDDKQEGVFKVSGGEFFKYNPCADLTEVNGKTEIKTAVAGTKSRAYSYDKKNTVEDAKKAYAGGTNENCENISYTVYKN